MSTGDSFHDYTYISDNGNQYTIKLSDAVASAGGFSSASGSPLGGGQPVWPWHERDMRHVTGVSGTKSGRLPIGGLSNPLYQAGGSFTLHGTTYTIRGAHGEDRAASHIR